jgi:hypothetical protein
MVELYILIGIFVLELAFRLIPTTVNYSIIDKVKEVAIMVHSIVDILIPNKVKDEKK